MDAAEPNVPEGTRAMVQLDGIPIASFVALQVYFDDIVRELQLIEVGRGGEGAGQRLADLALFVQHEIAWVRNLVHIHALAAEEEGRQDFDIALDLSSRAVSAASRLVEVVEALDEQSRQGLLLTVPADPAVMHLLRWFTDEVARQVGDGLPPRRYTPA